MDAALAGSIAELLKFGIAGVFIIALLFAVYTLWRTNLALTNQIAKLQEERLADVRQCTTALTNATTAMTKSADAMQGIQTAFSNLVTELQARRR